MATVRPLYRRLAALMAVLLVFSGALPLVAHACGMADPASDEHAAAPCCCAASAAHEGEAAGEHCPEEAPPPAHASAAHDHAAAHHAGDAQVQGDCCTSAVTQVQLSGILKVEQSTKVLAQSPPASFFAPFPPLLQEHRVGFQVDPDRLPAPSRSLHVLHAVFLN